MNPTLCNRVLSLLLVLTFFGTTLVSAQANQKMQEQITKLLEEKSRRTEVEKKISSLLLQAIRESRGQKMAEGVNLEPANVDADSDGNLQVDIRAVVSDTLLQAIKTLGGTILSSYPKYDAIRAQVHLSKIEGIAALSAIRFIGPAEKGQTIRAGNGVPAATGTDDRPVQRTKSSKIKSTFLRKRIPLKQRMENVKKQLEKYLQQQEIDATVLQSGSVNSQGDRAHRADDVRTTYGAQGQGIRIGVLSDSYNFTGGALSDIYSGNLPGPGNPNGNTTPVTVVQDYTSGTDEGRAMVQIVHDLAPKAQLYFATAFVSEAGFANNIVALRNTYNCDIIIDDIFYYDEPQFQDGIVAQAVTTVTGAGALYFSSAGNEGSVTRGTAGVFEGDFNDEGSLPFTGTATPGTIHNFGTVATPVNGDIVTVVGQRYTLIWSDSYYASTNDYDLFLVSSTGTVKAMSTNIQSGTQLAFEQIVPPALVTGDRLVVFKKSAAAVRAFCLNTFRGRLTNFTTGQTHGHSAIPDAYSVAAASALQTSGAPFSSGNLVETFSSDGLRRMFTNPNGTPITPGNVLFSTNGGLVRNKPDITAADGVSTTLPLNGGLNPFYGTSAAAPHAGAIAALIKGIQPSITPPQMRTLLTTTALDIQTAGYDNVSGFGIVQAFQAMQSLAPTIRADISLNSFAITESTGNGNGKADPGESINLFVNLKNPSPANATSVSATLSTTTAGVTVTGANATYGTIAAGASTTNTATPFVFSINSSVACGTQITFNLTVNFSNGGVSPQTFPIVVNVGNQPGAAISAILGTPAPSTSFYTSSTGTQTGRVNRFTPSSSCGTIKANPGLQSAIGSRTYDSYVFKNTTSTTQCVTCTYTAATTSMYVVAYDNNGFVPLTPNVNFLADQAQSGTGQSFSFNVASGQSFTIVVHEVTPATAVGVAYNLNVSLSSCTSFILPVTWLSFTAVNKAGQAEVQWKVANEINAAYYEVEHSTNGNQFSKLFTVAATTSPALQKTYTGLHPFPIKGNNYYRIRQVDKDGHFSYSKTALLSMEKANAIVLAPNPASSFVQVQARSAIERIRLYNAAGQLVMSASPAAASYTLNVSKLPTGTYSVVIESANETMRQKLVKD